MEKEHELVLKARWWSYRRQRLGRQAASLEEALHDVVGVYSSHPSAPLSLWARTASFSPDAFRSLEQEKRAVRIPAMRRSIHLLGRDDAAMVFTATRVSHTQNMSLLRYTGKYYSSDTLSVEAYPRLKEAILAVATDPLTPQQLRERLGEKGDNIAMLARIIAYEGELLRVGSDSLRSNSLRYISTSAWGAQLYGGWTRDEALSALAYRYLSAFGPARVKDFQWWAGISLAQASAAFATLDTITLTDGSLLLATDREAFEQVAPLADDSMDILPMWDSYTMGYAPDGRARIVSPSMSSRVYATLGKKDGGDGLGIVLMAGKAVATWNSTISGKRLDIKLDLFDSSALPFEQAMRTRFEEVASILSCTSCTVTVIDPEGPSLVSTVLARLRQKRMRT